MLSKLCIALLVVVAAVSGAPTLKSVCETQSLCVCHTSEGIIDLCKLAGATFNITTKEGQDYYQFNPCIPFTLGDSCNDVLGCQISPMSDPKYNAIASSIGYTYTKQGGNYAIEYKAGNRSMTMVLLCDENEDGKLNFVSEKPTDTYNFQLKSKHACLYDASTTMTDSTTVSSTSTAMSSTTTMSSPTTMSSSTMPSSTSTASSSTTMASSTTTGSSTTPQHSDSTTSPMSTGSSTSTMPGSTTTPSSSGSTMTSDIPSNTTTPSGNYTTMPTDPPTTQSGSVLSPLAIATLTLVSLVSRIFN